jgi:hypothetical protein
MSSSQMITFTVPHTKDDMFVLEIEPGTMYEMTIPDHVAAGQTLKARMNDELIMLEYCDTEGKTVAPEIVIGRMIGPSTSTLVKVKATVEQDENICITCPDYPFTK